MSEHEGVEGGCLNTSELKALSCPGAVVVVDKRNHNKRAVTCLSPRLPAAAQISLCHSAGFMANLPFPDAVQLGINSILVTRKSYMGGHVVG